MINFTPEGLAAEFFQLFGRDAPPPPPGALPPVLWGSEEHVRGLFGDGVSSLQMTRKHAVETLDGTPRDYADFYEQTFGPVVALFGSFADDPARAAALDAEFLDSPCARTAARRRPRRVPLRDLLVVARKG